MNEESARTYKPAEVARRLSDRYAHKVTASVIRKWDNLVLHVVKSRTERGRGENRGYSERDIEIFNLIAILRNLGYTLQDTKDVLEVIFGDGNYSETDTLDEIRDLGDKNDVVVEVMNRMARQEQGFVLAKHLLRGTVSEQFGARLDGLFPKMCT